MKPIVVRAESGTEVVTHLRLLQHTFEKNVSRFEVRLFAHMENQWGECFRSTIHIDYRESSKEVDGGHEAGVATENYIRDYEHAKRVSVNRFNNDEFYRWLRDRGLKYGRLFALAEDIHWDGGTLSVARVNVPQLPDQFEGTVHPAVLDASCHMCVAAPSQGMTKAIPTMVPASIKNGWISARGWSQLQEV
ncbi:hypothetical protein GGR54DRAFT_485575 [Hypoxylon sp. NC1633]|nr:hypothetical protein GGR54DRAFT_485575 [Hypoxylon sp. NC1633]